ncbi:STAS domain-containing protein [Micromonospora sp. NPDC047548]|uniref:STAS domain-containing protein n=1 Tax=Micromonospora sp. NPDC047548 TaxID=3155624 RepID=UPI0033DF8872
MTSSTAATTYPTTPCDARWPGCGPPPDGQVPSRPRAALAAREQLTSTLLAAVASAPVVVVDAGALDFLDSTGIHGLVTAHHTALAAGGRPYLVKAAGGVANVLDITGVGDLLRHPADDDGSRQR